MSSRALRGWPGLLLGVSLLTALSVACAPTDESTDSADTSRRRTARPPPGAYPADRPILRRTADPGPASPPPAPEARLVSNMHIL